jgi:putative radical SAM enzyme (TIGR03279 family)
MHGHYITLTNLKDEDYARIISERLSPLCVSVHATDPATRIKMVGNKNGGEIMERMQFLIENGIQLNTQVVLCPGWNDGELLERSVRDIMSLRPGVESMAVVPAGLTKFLPSDRGLRTVRPEEARVILRQLEPFQEQSLQETGARFVYASDEMYLLADEPVPPAEYYDGFPQYANGVGTIRAFLDEVAKLRRKRKRAGIAPKITLVTGALAAPALRELSAALLEKNIARARVKEIKNTYWGGNVGCAGLIMGEEILSQMRGEECGDFVFLPPDAVDGKGRMLDDITLDELSAALRTPVRRDANGPLELAEILRELD